MKATAQTTLHAGRNAVFAPYVARSLIGQKHNAWTIVDAIQTAADEIEIHLEGSLPFIIHLRDREEGEYGS